MALLLLCCAAVACCVSAAPAAHERSAADAWLMDAAAQHAAPRRITPKSIFIAPSFSHASLPACADGYRPDAMGRCVKVVRVDPAAQLDFLLRRLNAMYAAPAPPPPPPRPASADASGPLQLSLSLGEEPASSDVRGSGSSVEEVAVVLADVVKDTADVPQTMLAVWNISKNTTSGDAPAAVPGSAKRNATAAEFLSGLSLPRVEETMPIVMQTPPSTLVIQDPPGPDAVSRPLSSEVDFDIAYYDYYQDHDAADSRCANPPCKNSFAEINSRSPHAPVEAAPTEDATERTTAESATASSPTTGDARESATCATATIADVALQSDVGDDAVAQQNKHAASPVGNATDVDIAGDVNTSRPNKTRAVLPEIHVASFETSVEVSVKHLAGKVNRSEEVADNSTDVYSDVTRSDVPSTDVYTGETTSDIPSTDVYTGETMSNVPNTDVYTGETSSDVPSTDVYTDETSSDVPSTDVYTDETSSDELSTDVYTDETSSDVPSTDVYTDETSSDVYIGDTSSDVSSTDIYSGETTTDVPPTTELLEANATADAGANAEPETLPKKPSTLPDESSLIGTSMDPLSDVDAGDGPDATEQRSAAPGRPHSGAKSGRVRFPDDEDDHAPPPAPPPFWWLPAGWRLDHSRHHPVLLRFWRRYGGGRDAHFYRTHADG